MSDGSDRDLSAAFEELHAPASTAGYATRSPGLDVPSSARSRSWPQALAGVLAVALALAGAGTFLALRNARQGGAPAGSAANPPARSGAAMAYDSTTGVTVMYGGTDGAGRALTDTWTWDGSAWAAAARGPGALTDVRMVDDPAAGGVLLVGMPAPKVTGSGGGGVVGCISSGSGTASPGSVSGGTSGAAGRSPSIATAPAAPGPPVAAATPPATPVTTCPAVTVSPTERTWLFSANGWKLAPVGSTANSPVAGAQLTFDTTTRQVVAVSSSFFSCGPPLETPVGGAAIRCPFEGKAASTAVPCDAVGACLGSGAISTWTWSRGAWQKRAPATLQASGTILLFDDPATGHATLMTQYGLGFNECPKAVACPLPATSAVPPVVTTWGWSGSRWSQLSQVRSPQPAPSFAGASMAAVAGHILVLTGTGQTWTFAAGQWTQDTVAGHPSTRSGAAMAEGPSQTVVLFGGTAGYGFAVPMLGPSARSAVGAAGSDTWVWNGNQWRHVAGVAPSPPPTPTACPDVKSLGLSCVGPPTRVPPSTPLGIPSSAKGSPAPLTAP